ncbi:hypothetical protein MOQ72_36290 [Saccharopolyspora sp. K220]|uniref:hypothetical protein n=1 Tax=Saccharopolyspora soli TaxID=2926618 RepID=UPI001F5629B4|nr:hypothetical protein [Saccharopolyspora soli]MCI2422899.1 hypothetical protein [Saccharopolyspora soli]
MARKLNQVFGAGTVAESAPFQWRDAGVLPRRSPLPTMTAYVLSEALGRTISVDELWQGKATDSPTLVPADDGLTGPWTPQDLTRIAKGWVLGGLVDRRRFLALSGAGLVSLVSQYLEVAGHGAFAPRLAAVSSDDPLVDQIDCQVPLLQRLDDAQGGARHLPYVGAQFRAVALLLHEGGHSERARTRLIQALAEIGQLVGWMAFDTSDHGLAQRYWGTALRAAHQVNDRPLCAHILADLAFQAASRGHASDAVVLGETAQDVSRTATAAVRAAVLSRLGYAYAAAGRTREFDRARYDAREVVEQGPQHDDPRWMYFLTSSHLDCQAGYALIELARQQQGAKDTAAKRRLAEGASLLETGAYGVPTGHPSQRRALYEGAWLALAYASRGHHERACEIGRLTTGRLDTVRSPRSLAVLRQLAVDLRRRRRNKHVREFLPELEDSLARQIPTMAAPG